MNFHPIQFPTSPEDEAILNSAIALIRSRYPNVDEKRVRDAILQPAIPTPANSSEQQLEIEAAAKHIGLSETTVWRLTKKGVLPVVRLGRRTFYLVSDLDKLLQRASGAR